MPANDPSQIVTIAVLVGIIMICVILCIVKIQGEIKDMDEKLNYKLDHQIKSDISKTVGECIDSYIASKTNILSPTTISKYKNIRRSQLSPDFLKIKMKALKGIDVQNEINRLSGTQYAKGKTPLSSTK